MKANNFYLTGITLAFVLFGSLACDHASQPNQQATSVVERPDSEKAAKQAADKFMAESSGIDWKAFVRGYQKNTFYAKSSMYGGEKGFDKYEAYRLVGATHRADIRKIGEGSFTSIVQVDLTFRGPKGYSTISMTESVPTMPDANKELAERFWTKDPIGSGTPRYIREAIKNNQLAIGMTEEQVYMVKGSPEDRNSTTYSYGTSGLWIYRNYGTTTHVFFSNGRVSSVSHL
jgi:hypothetical protein